MAALNDRFWAKVLFSQFIKHYRKMNDEQIVADIKQAMDDLEDLIDEGTSFGAKMVRWSMERADEPSAIASRENGKKGGRPRKDSVEDGARESQRRAGADSVRWTPLHSAPARSSGTMPADVQVVYDFAAAENLDPVDAYECWNVTVNERDGKAADGKRITNWKAYVRKWCATRKNNRRTA